MLSSPARHYLSAQPPERNALAMLAQRLNNVQHSMMKRLRSDIRARALADIDAEHDVV